MHVGSNRFGHSPARLSNLTETPVLKTKFFRKLNDSSVERYTKFYHCRWVTLLERLVARVLQIRNIWMTRGEQCQAMVQSRGHWGARSRIGAWQWVIESSSHIQKCRHYWYLGKPSIAFLSSSTTYCSLDAVCHTPFIAYGGSVLHSGIGECLQLSIAFTSPNFYYLLGQIPRANQKDLRFVDKLFNDILKRTLLSSIVFNVHQGNLDLSLFETLATDQNGPEPTGIAVLVKRLTIISLDPRTPSTKEPMTHPPSKVEITICQRRLTSLLGQALYGLRKITHLKSVFNRVQFHPQPDS